MREAHVHPVSAARRPPGRRAVMVVTLALAVATLAIAGAAPAFAAFTHPTTDLGGSPIVSATQCWGCHSSEATQWKNSSPYSSTDPNNVFFGLQGHNVTMPQTLLNAAHNTEELLTDECVTCHSPFSVKHVDGSAATIGEFVQPLDQTGPWAIIEPYATAIGASNPSGFWFLTDTPAPSATQSAWEGISCRVCHDINSLDSNGYPRLRFFDPATYAYSDVTSATDLCTRCHQTGSDDSRTPDPASVHAGLQCTDCHMTNTDGTISHTLSAGPADGSGTLANTACGRTGCHASPGNPAGHPDVTMLATSLSDPATYAADPLNIQWDANQRHNVHFITCDTCHQPTGVKATYTVVYGSAVKVSGARTSKPLPAAADSGVVSLWAQNKGAGQAMVRQAQSTDGAAGTVFTLSWVPRQNSDIAVTQALSADGTTAGFPGLGRGVSVHVSVKDKVTLAVSKAKVHPRTVVVISGKVLPAHAGKKIVIQKRKGSGSWATWKTVTLSAASGYSAKWTAPTLKAKYSFRAKFTDTDGLHVSNISAAKVVVVY